MRVNDTNAKKEFRNRSHNLSDNRSNPIKTTIRLNQKEDKRRV